MGPKKDSRRAGVGGHGKNRKLDVTTITDKSERQRVFSECSEDQCAVCWNDIKVYAVGICNHSICYVCSIRMRVLCSQNDCCICRQDMPKIILSEKKCNFNELTNNVMKMERKYQICFENENVKKMYEELIQHKCERHENPMVFRNMKQLDTHCRRDHELFFCDLCTNHLKIFSHERKLYTRSELATHRRKGDSDDSSHKGHPLCEFCEIRYVDNDELFRHLRRDHFFCHFCDADGVQNFYPNYGSLRDHFSNKHYICLEGDCANEQFTNAFRSELDLKAHRLEKHSLSKSEAKLNRLVDVDVTFNRSNNHHHYQNHRRGHRDRDHHAPTDYEYETASEPKQPEAVPDFTQDFPSLHGGASGGSTSAVGGASSSSGQSNNQSNLAKKLAISSGRNVQSQDWSSKTGNGPKLMEEDDFPSLPGAQPKLLSKPQKNYEEFTRKKVEGSNSKTKNPTHKNDKTSDFPDLPTSTANLHSFGSSVYRNPSGYSPAWTSQSKKTNSSEKSKMPKPSKIAPAPDFPELGKPSAPTPPVHEPKPNKQKAKKQQQAEIKSVDKNHQNHNKSTTNGSAAGLASAADLIFSNKPKTKKENSNVPMNVAGQNTYVDEEDDDDNRYLKNGVKNEGYSGSTPNPSINLVASLPPKEPPPGFNSSNKSKNFKKTPEGDDFPRLPGGGAQSKLFSKPQKSYQELTSKKVMEEGSSTNSKSKTVVTNNGRDYPKKPSSSRSSYNYISPPDFNSRNSKLMGTISTAFGGAKSLEFNSFKSVSNQFRSGKIGANIYLEECSKLLDDDATKFEDFLPEMITLLPNICKQKELMDAYQKQFPKSRMPSDLSKCETCSQILKRQDKRIHEEYHAIDDDFPAL